MKKHHESTIGELAKAWNSAPEEWGMCGTESVIYDPKTPVRFYHLDDVLVMECLYPDGLWYSTGLVVEESDIQ